MDKVFNFDGVSSVQLKEIKRILEHGVFAASEAQDKKYDYLCHKNPPKGFPRDREKYGDGSCFRYPINTKARALAAWRYIHQASNKKILGDRFTAVEGKIKSYAKKHYDLDLQVGESEIFDWEQAFVEYYDAETMGERCELVELEPDEATASNEEEQTVDELETIKAQLAEKEGELESTASQLTTLNEEITSLKTEVETLRAYKEGKEQEAELAELLKNRKAKVEAAGLDINIETESEKWLAMSDDVFDFTITQISEMSKGAKATAAIKVPNIQSESSDARAIVREALKEHKSKKVEG